MNEKLGGVPLVSIVTPVRNRAAMIETCLASVQAQTHPAVEHIVVDGGSTDGTIELLGKFESRHSFRYISEPDTGMYDAINKGLTLARGTVIGYLNSDDVYMPWSVAAAVQALERGADFIYGDLGILVADDTSSVAFYPQFYRPFDLNFYTHLETLGQPTVFWTRAATERIGSFDTSYKLLGDCEYWLRAASGGARFEHVHELLALQVEHPQTLRVTAAAQLEAEFERLRRTYTAAAGSPRGVRLHPMRRRIWWRRNQIRFIFEAMRSRPQRWPQFMAFLRRNGIPIRKGGLLWFLLPRSLRPEAASLVDPQTLKKSLMTELFL